MAKMTNHESRMAGDAPAKNRWVMEVSFVIQLFFCAAAGTATKKIISVPTPGVL